MPPHLLYDYTWAEIHIVLSGAGLKARREHKLTLWGHWNGQSFARQKRLTPLTNLMRRLEPARDMSSADIRKAVLGMAHSMGAKVIRRKKQKEP